jgi:hypothetical protein
MIPKLSPEAQSIDGTPLWLVLLVIFVVGGLLLMMGAGGDDVD